MNDCHSDSHRESLIIQAELKMPRISFNKITYYGNVDFTIVKYNEQYFANVIVAKQNKKLKLK